MAARDCMTAVEAATKLNVHHQFLVGFMLGAQIKVDRIGRSYAIPPGSLPALRKQIRKARGASLRQPTTETTVA